MDSVKRYLSRIFSSNSFSSPTGLPRMYFEFCRIFEQIFFFENDSPAYSSPGTCNFAVNNIKDSLMESEPCGWMPNGISLLKSVPTFIRVLTKCTKINQTSKQRTRSTRPLHDHACHVWGCVTQKIHSVAMAKSHTPTVLLGGTWARGGGSACLAWRVFHCLWARVVRVSFCISNYHVYQSL